MKQNKPPLFVKLFEKTNQKINQKQLLNLWGQPQSKQFHIIDNPSLINKLASIPNKKQKNYTKFKIQTQCDEYPNLKKQRYILKKTKKSQQRVKFGRLTQQVNFLSQFIQNSISELHQSQIFEYKQKMLTKFLDKFFKQLETQCHQKAAFIRRIWNQMIVTFDRIFSISQNIKKQNQSQSLNQILRMHKSYQQMLMKTKQQNRNLSQQNQKQKQLVRSLVLNLRERRKQIKVYQGGLSQYNNQINDLTNQFSQLKKQHLDILMYGHTGNMTRQQAQDLLFDILRPKRQDQKTLNNQFDFTFKTPKLQKGKSDKYLISQTENQLQRQNQFDSKFKSLFSSHLLVSQNQVYQCIQSESFNLKNNFGPKKLKNKSKMMIDQKIQTQNHNLQKQKCSSSVQCSYFSRMEQYQIKNKYIQTQNKRLILINVHSQTDDICNFYSLRQKCQNLKIQSHIITLAINNSIRKHKNSDLKSMQMNSSCINWKQQKIQFQVQEQQNQNIDQTQLKFKSAKGILKDHTRQGSNKKRDQKTQENKKIKRDDSKKSKRFKNQSIYNSRTIIDKQEKKHQKLISKLKTEGDNQPVTKILIKTQNFIKFNKARVSVNKKCILNSFIKTCQQKSNFLTQISENQKNIRLFITFFNSNYLHNSSPLCPTNKSIKQSKKTFKLFPAQSQALKVKIINNQSSLLKKACRIMKKIKQKPSQQQLLASVFFNNKQLQNINIGQTNKFYVHNIKQYVQELKSNSNNRKSDKSSVASQSQVFTLKRAYKILNQIFQICENLFTQKKSIQINLVQILQRVLDPFNYHQKQNNQKQMQGAESTKVLQFLKYLTKNIDQSYLIKNFLYLCGVSFKISQINRNQTSIVNINKNVSIQGQKQRAKKHISIENAVKYQYLHNQILNQQRQRPLPLMYSSEISFYFTMFRKLNCYKNGHNDVQNSYTTLELLQKNFQQLKKFYANPQILGKIKNFILQSMSNTMLEHSKLNIFKCLQIFLQKIVQTKIQLRCCYSSLFSMIFQKNKQYSYDELLCQVLELMRASPQTQLKIIQKYHTLYNGKQGIQDLITLFITEGIPQVQKVKQVALKHYKLNYEQLQVKRKCLQNYKSQNSKNSQQGPINSYQMSLRSNNYILDVFHDQILTSNDKIRFLEFNQMQKQIVRQQLIKRQIMSIIDCQLQTFGTLCLFLNNKNN